MIRHYFKLARKALLKNKYYTLINVFGLVFGMLSALIIAKYIGGSLQFDNTHLKKDRIYSLTQEESINGNFQKNRLATYWGAGDLLHQYPEITRITRYSFHVNSLIMADDENGNRVSFMEDNIFAADSSFLKVFTFPLIYGNPATALSRVNSVIVTRATSQKYFGHSNPIGKVITIRVPWGQETLYEVTGVADDIPQQSQFRFDFLITSAPINPAEAWDSPDYTTFLLLQEGATTDAVSKGLTKSLNTLPQLKSTNRKVTISLDALTDIRLSSTEYVLIAVGIFVILISWSNYINQVIAQSYWRAKEIGIHRVLGATKANLKTQFIVESSLICLISLTLIVGIYLTAEPFLQSFTDGHVLPLIGDPTPINFVFLAIFICGAILAAAIPTVILFLPNFGTTLQSVYNSKIGNIGLRQVLVILQFSISTILIISVSVISSQLTFMNSKDKGIDMENILIVQAPILNYTWETKIKALELFKAKCAELPFVTAISSSTTVPSEEYRQETYLSFQDTNNKAMVHQNGVDDQFFNMYDVKFIAGHNFIPDARWKNKNSIILNESAARALGIVDFEKSINTKITDHESNDVFDLVGIIADYHQTSLKYEMEPVAFKFNVARGHFSLRINRESSNALDLEEKSNAIKQAWKETYEDAPFDHFFLDERFSAQDREDQYFGKLFSYFTFLSIVISCLGLFGLSLVISTKRQKEIGVRKVFGASSMAIVGIFLRSYLGSLCIAVTIGVPVSYWMMDLWLNNYAYRIDIEFGLILIALCGVTMIFLFTIAYHTIKSAIANPVKILRD